MININIVKKPFLIISILLYLISLTQDAFYVDNINHDAWSNSLVLLLVGWIGAIMGGYAALTWFANPLIFFSWLFFLKNVRVSFCLSLCSFILSISFLFFDNVITSEAPTFSKITSYEIGYWIWLLSILLIFLGSSIILILENKNKKRNA